MRQRILTGIIGGAFIAAVTYFGGNLYDLVYFGITCIGIYELSRIFFDKNYTFGAAINYVFALAVFTAKTTDNLQYFNFIIFLFISFAFTMFVFNKDIDLKKLCETIFIGSYVVFFMYHMMLMNDSKFVWLVYIIAFGTDTFAYFTGKQLGRHKLYPRVSPNKTIEGAIGGIIGCTIISIFYFDYLRINKLFYIIIFSVSASVFSMVGDLAASKIKREFGIKDYGNLLPGHGGILDRFDSVLFVAPIVYYFVSHFIE
jgi:phosphatidate cytidylyltransferase